jgi:hypothetical protein
MGGSGTTDIFVHEERQLVAGVSVTVGQSL